MFLFLLAFSGVKAQNDTNAVDLAVSSYLTNIDSSAASLQSQFSSYSSTTSIAASDSRYQNAQGLTSLLLTLDAMLRSSQNAPHIDQGVLGDALDSLSDLFLSLSYYSEVVEGPLANQLPNLANGALNIVSDVATLPGYGCSQLASWTEVASLYEAAAILSSAWSFNALINSNLEGFCSDFSMTSVNVPGPPQGSVSPSTGASEDHDSDSSEVKVSGSTSESSSANGAHTLLAGIWGLCLLI